MNLILDFTQEEKDFILQTLEEQQFQGPLTEIDAVIQSLDQLKFRFQNKECLLDIDLAKFLGKGILAAVHKGYVSDLRPIVARSTEIVNKLNQAYTKVNEVEDANTDSL